MPNLRNYPNVGKKAQHARLNIHFRVGFVRIIYDLVLCCYLMTLRFLVFLLNPYCLQRNWRLNLISPFSYINKNISLNCSASLPWNPNKIFFFGIHGTRSLLHFVTDMVSTGIELAGRAWFLLELN